jgi:hypothetical protein
MAKNGANKYSPQNRKGEDRPLVWSRDMPLKEHEYERFREPDFWLEVWIFSLLMALMAGALVLGAAKLRGSEEPWAWAFAGAGLFGGLVAIWRIRTLDDTEVLRREYDLYQDVQFHEPMTLTRRPKPVDWRGKHFAFQGWQLDRLLSWYQAGQDRRIRRDRSGAGRGWIAWLEAE